MDKVYTIREAQKWFLSHSSGNVIVINADGIEKECSYYFEAEDFLNKIKS